MGEEQGDRKAFISRIGTFFLIIGILLVVLFIASDIGEVTYFSYFFLGGFGILLGLFFKRISAPPPKPGTRFEGIRKWQQKQREAKAKKEAARTDKNKKK